MNRRLFPWLLLAAVLQTAHGFSISGGPIPEIRVLVWDEQNKGQKAYTNFIAAQIASSLKTVPFMSVRSAGLDDTNLGLSDEALTNTDVLIYWSHVRNKLVPDEKA